MTRKVRLNLGRPKGATCGGCASFLRSDGAGAWGACYSNDVSGRGDEPAYGATRPADASACPRWSEP